MSRMPALNEEVVVMEGELYAKIKTAGAVSHSRKWVQRHHVLTESGTARWPAIGKQLCALRVYRDAICFLFQLLRENVHVFGAERYRADWCSQAEGAHCGRNRNGWCVSCIARVVQ
jgi:hypothetical protein